MFTDLAVRSQAAKVVASREAVGRDWANVLDHTDSLQPVRAILDGVRLAGNLAVSAVRTLYFANAYTGSDAWREFPLELHGNRLQRVAQAIVAREAAAAESAQ